MTIRKSSFIRDGREITLCQNFSTRASDIISKPINPKTGKGWQKGKFLYQSAPGEAMLKAFAVFQRMKKG